MRYATFICAAILENFYFLIFPARGNDKLTHLLYIFFHLFLVSVEFIEQLELIQAKVPIIRFRDTWQNLQVDLNCNNAVGIRNTQLLYCYSKRKFLINKHGAYVREKVSLVYVQATFLRSS